jgi:uncharacterized protein YjbJ (UPF0337 family)
MNWDQIEGNWLQAKGAIKEKWGKLTDNDLDQIAGKRDQLLGRLQKLYGITKEEAERQLHDYERHSNAALHR